MTSFCKVLDRVNPDSGQHVLELLKAGLGVEIRGKVLAILGAESDADVVDSRGATVLDVLPGGEIILQQTEPLVLASHLGSPVEISATVRGDEGPYRRGVMGRLVDLRPDFCLGPQQMEAVFIVKLVSPVKIKSLSARVGVRVDLDSQSLVSFAAPKIKVFPSNISVGGVGFNCPRDQVKEREHLTLALDLMGRRHPVRIKVVRVANATTKHDYVGGQFLTEDQDPTSWRRVRDLLQARIMAEQARQIAKDKGAV